MDIANVFSFQHIMLILAALVGAVFHYFKGKLQGDYLGFWQWLISRSPVKSISVGVLILVGTSYLALSGVSGVPGWLLAGLMGFFFDSILKRVSELVGNKS